MIIKISSCLLLRETKKYRTYITKAKIK